MPQVRRTMPRAWVRRLRVTVALMAVALAAACGAIAPSPEGRRPSTGPTASMESGGPGELATAGSGRTASAPPGPSATVASALGAEGAPRAVPPLRAALAPELAHAIDEAARGAIARAEVPGAVVVVARAEGVLFRRAYGVQAVEPSREPMREETLFDLASLTKPIVTATLALQLVEQGRLHLSERLSQRLPEAISLPTADITVEQLLHHRAGLPAANSLADFAHGRDEAIRRMLSLPRSGGASAGRLYSDVGYLLLGLLVERVTGRPLDELARQQICAPLGATCGYRPDASLAPRIAPTERSGSGWLRGQVHDPRARALGGVAGHAGLFATADDVARYARMILRRGELDGVRLLAPESVAALVRLDRGLPAPNGGAEPTPHALLGGVVAGGIAHSGFTGTYLWIDTAHDLALVVLTSRLHPDGKGSADRLRRELVGAVAVAAARRAILAVEAPPGTSVGSGAPAPVATGIDQLVDQSFAPLAGRRIALLTHGAGRCRDGRRTIDALAAAPRVELVRLLSPEHGIDSTAEGAIASGRDGPTGLPIISLYGRHRRPEPADLAGIDTVVVDLQHVGTRFFTYETTLCYVLEAAAAARKRVVVLDRPNPLGGIGVEGPVLDPGRESFVGAHALPIRHGLTMGELARLLRAERRLDLELEIVALRGWRREMLFDDTGLVWVPPSPNLPSAEAALLYPGIGMLETTNLSVGRGTGRPFALVGAPWVDSTSLAESLSRAGLDGVRFEPVEFMPTSSTFSGQACHGVAIAVTDPRTLRSVRVGLGIAVALQARHGAAWRVQGLDQLLGDASTLDAIRRGKPAATIELGWQRELADFEARRAPFLLY